MTEKNKFIVNLNLVDIYTLFCVPLSMYALVLLIGKQFEPALVLLYLSIFVDCTDGVLARKYKLSSVVGRYLDSFCDVLNYLIVPAVFIYQLGMQEWYYLIVMAVSIALGIVRLAVVNDLGIVKNKKGEMCYLGLPVWHLSFFLGIIYLTSLFFNMIYVFPLMGVALAIHAFFMIYNIKIKKLLNLLMLSIATLGQAAFFIILILLRVYGYF
jgi:CDP-diacylglycerol--serine O-phosphatidyltransferase